MPKPMITLPTSQKHALLLDMAIRRSPTQSRTDMLLRFGDQLAQYGNLTSGQLGLCHATLTSSR
ncbi:hypothetical protein ACQR1Y_12390 [Bradyrhizobium sp. HKCCYLRH3099]|uniref:hypothetical protein n=1 Tax=Bradyrhizobium TaxID=374 RepID=UPI003EBF6C34